MREPRNERVSAKFQAAHTCIREFSKENSKLNETRYFNGSFKRSLIKNRRVLSSKRDYPDSLPFPFKTTFFIVPPVEILRGSADSCNKETVR